ncbi:MAG: metallophosphoesterase family protein [Desulfobacteraceae bacterium]|nr:metallophosphoesterase family protein [Desulfobacteraceae bacterium]
MKLAIISDIHSNFEALESVLKDIKKVAVDEIISLGDNIGYGADPEKVIQTIKQNNIESVLGNHEYACIEDTYLITFNKRAKKALLINKGLLSSESLEYISNLNEFIIRYNCRFVHGLPPDSVTRYVTHESKSDLALRMRSIPEQISFIGHTHHLWLYENCNGQIKITGMDKTKLSLDKNNSYIVNTGSVGQPRGNSINARYVIWDSKERTIEPRSVTYNNKKAARKIIQAGIPEIYSERVEKGTP